MPNKYPTNDGSIWYSLNFTPNHAYFEDSSGTAMQRAVAAVERLGYEIRVSVHRGSDGTFYVHTCDNVASSDDTRRISVGLDVPVGEYVYHSNNYEVRMEVAAVFGGVASEYVTLEVNREGEMVCDIPVVIGE